VGGGIEKKEEGRKRKVMYEQGKECREGRKKRVEEFSNFQYIFILQ
jgi:hypothetical protein